MNIFTLAVILTIYVMFCIDYAEVIMPPHKQFSYRRLWIDRVFVIFLLIPIVLDNLLFKKE